MLRSELCERLEAWLLNQVQDDDPGEPPLFERESLLGKGLRRSTENPAEIRVTNA